MVSKTYIGLGALVILVLVMVLVNKTGTGGSTNIPSSDPSTVSPTSSGDEQIVLLGLDNAGNYKPKEIVVQAGKTVVLKNDGSLGGCSLYPIQQELGLAGNLAKNKEVRFVPQKKGRFPFSCSMGMYKGIIKVI
ncbi:cupredoxin domain-containing protein [Candidatus Woesearchaeota archaeon]|nr:cupredoxin domain-containing protein [Candidatus Woesearchaeota archaeon]